MTLCAVACLSVLFRSGPSLAQPAEVSGIVPPRLPSVLSEQAIDSGEVVGGDGGVIFTKQVAAPWGAWTRLRFGEETDLGDPEAPGEGAILTITSELDGAVQVLDAESIVQWGYTSAYFNGSSLSIELHAPPGGGPFRVVVEAVVGGGAPDAESSICGLGDDRTASEDPRVGRILPAVCTGWIANDCNRCMFTAGHCQPNGGLQVLQFNVPLSEPDGDMVMPPPEDQYAIDPDSIQGNGGNGVGNDWAHFGCFPNSNTGLTPAEAQGEWFVLDPGFAGGSTTEGASGAIRVTGYGQATDDLPGEWNFAQTTATGPLGGASGTTIEYMVDTTPGDSGAPVIDEATGRVIGIHTTGGCESTGVSGANAGTGAWHADVQYAFQHGQGVCKAPELDIDVLTPLPEVLVADEPAPVLFLVKPADGLVPDPDGVSLSVGVSGVEGGAMAFEIIEAKAYVPGLGLFKADFPDLACGQQVEFFLTAQATDGTKTFFPALGAGASATAFVADAVVDHASFDFESAPGWSVWSAEELTDGEWELGVPVADGGNAPTSDYDGSGQCFLTRNAPGNSDVDGGPTVLISPPFDLSGGANPVLSYARWFNNDDLDQDRLDVEVSSDGEEWVLLESVSHVPGWRVVSFTLREHVQLSDSVRVRFSVADQPNNSKTEAAIDRFRIQDFLCGAACPADFNGDGALNELDFIAFQVAFAGGDLAADLNQDGVLGTFDFVAFAQAFAEGC